MTAQTILEHLVSYDVLSQQNNLALVDWIAEYLKSFGIDVVYVYNETGTQASLHARIGPAVDGGVILSGHTDVVPVEGQAWDTDPFILIEKDQKLYGRGACDMKGFLACCLAVVPDMIKAPLKRPIYLAISYDEEIGCLRAPELASHMKAYYTEKPKYAIIGEPSMLQPIIGQKGILYIQTTVTGSEGHSSRIEKEVSAIHEAARLVMWLEAKMHTLSEISINPNFVPPHSTIHVGQFNGGIATNIVADKVVFNWDVRSIPEDKIHVILESFNAYCRALEEEKRQLFPDFSIINKPMHPIVPGLLTDKQSDIVTLVREISECDTVNYVSYATEAGQFAEAGFQSIICGPGSIEQAHRANEYISIAQLQAGVQMIKKLVQQLIAIEL